MIWVFIWTGECLHITALECVHYRVETSLPKAMDAQKRESMH